jgi:DNA-directed RNA polymerase subunit RPC12/RpoP
MAINNYKISRTFIIGERVYIPTYGSDLPLEYGTATPFTIVGINYGAIDKSTELIVTCPHHGETLKLAVMANLAYKVTSATCSHCGHEVCFEADKEIMKEYEYYCPDCDENLYGIELNR